MAQKVNEEIRRKLEMNEIEYYEQVFIDTCNMLDLTKQMLAAEMIRAEFPFNKILANIIQQIILAYGSALQAYTGCRNVQGDTKQ